MNLRKIIVITCILLLGLTSLVWAAEAKTNSSKKIVYSLRLNRNTDLYDINGDGTGLIRLTDSEVHDLQPQLSPDGQKVLYLSGKPRLINTKYDLWVVDIDGKNRIKLADNIKYDYLPQWSPDSSMILFVTRDEKNKIVRINADGSNKTILTQPDTKGLYPSWSPDGSKILCYLNKDDKPGLYLMNPDGKDKKKLTKEKGNYSEIAWSPDGNRIAYVYSRGIFNFFGRKEGLYIGNLNNNKEILLYDEDSIQNIDWCPDGKTLSFVQHFSESYKSGDEIKAVNYYKSYIIDANGESEEQELPYTRNSNPVIPKWSPDGLKLGYANNSKVYIIASGKKGILDFSIPHGLVSCNWSKDSSKVISFGHPGFFAKPEVYRIDYMEDKIYRLTEHNE